MESLEPCRVVTVGEVLGGYGVRSRIRLVRIRRMVIHRLSGGASLMCDQSEIDKMLDAEYEYQQLKSKESSLERIKRLRLLRDKINSEIIKILTKTND